MFLAAQQVDEPDGPWFTELPFRGWLTVGWGGDPREVWLVRDPAEGSVAGWYRLELPDLENLDQADLDAGGAPGATAARAGPRPAGARDGPDSGARAFGAQWPGAFRQRTA